MGDPGKQKAGPVAGAAVCKPSLHILTLHIFMI